MKLVGIEANIGTGKSSLLPALVNELNSLDTTGKEWKQIQEPVDEPMFTELLTKFYEEPTTENRVRFQFYVTDRRHDMLQDLDTSYNYVIERSLYSDIIFCHLNFLEMEAPTGVYMGYFYYIKKRMDTYPKIDDIVYLRCDPVRSHSSIMYRGRECEQDIELSYIQDLESFHKACLPQQCRVYGAKLHTFDWTDFGKEIGGARTIAKAILGM